MKRDKSDIYRIKDFSFKYPFTENDISIKGEILIKEGESLLLSGNSGSGKSTLLLALKGLIPDKIKGKISGEILFHGKNILNTHESEKTRIGFVFQNPNAQMILKTVKNEIAFGLENMKIKPEEIKSKVQEISIALRISHLLERDTSSLSGGEKQKVALASVLAMNPEVILLDEPTAFLDRGSATDFIDEIRKLKNKKTIIMVEHNLEFLTDSVDNAVVIGEKETYKTTIQQIIKREKLGKLENAPKSGENILCAENISFAYGKTKLLENLDFKLSEGEIVGIIGKNGSGKSTLLKILSRLVKPDNGKVFFKGTDIFRIPERKYYESITILFQNPENHFIHDTVEKEASLNTDILERFGLLNHKNRNPYTLSEGQKRRLSVAGVYSHERKVYLMDEPTFGQDLKNREVLASLIRIQRDEGKSFVIVSHDLNFLRAISSRILKLHGGRLENHA